MRELNQPSLRCSSAGKNISAKINITPPGLNKTQWITPGLIIHKVITNSLKYAFIQEGAQPWINVSQTIPEDMAGLLIAQMALVLLPWERPR